MMETIQTVIGVFALAGFVLYAMLLCSLWRHPEE